MSIPSSFRQAVDVPLVRAALVVVVAAMLPFVRGLSYPLLHDDRWAVVDNPVVDGTIDPARILASNAWGNEPTHLHIPNYRPLSVLTLAATRAWTGLAPLPFRATNVLLHALCSLLVLLLAWRLRIGAIPATLAAVWFALHPVHVEAVMFAVNREELIATLAVLGALAVLAPRLVPIGGCLDGSDGPPHEPAPGPSMDCADASALSWRRHVAALHTSHPLRPLHIAAAALLLALGLLGKETAVVLPLLMATTVALWRPARGNWRGPLVLFAVMSAVVAAYLVLRWTALGRLTAGFVPWQDNPLVREGLGGRLTGAAVVLLEAAGLLVAPLSPTVDYGFDALRVAGPGTGLAAIGGVAVLVAWVAGLAASVRRSPAVAFGLLLLGVAWALFANVAFCNSIVLAERNLYLASAGAALAAGGALDLATARGAVVRRAAFGVAAAWIVLFASVTFPRVGDFRDAATLYASSLANRPGSARLHYDLALARDEAGDVAGAEAAYREAAAIDPSDPEILNNLGEILVRQGRPSEAVPELLRALRERPGHRTSLANLCDVLAAGGDPAAAETVCSQAAAAGVDVSGATRALEARRGEAGKPGTDTGFSR